jgi:hypothetical protein
MGETRVIRVLSRTSTGGTLAVTFAGANLVVAASKTINRYRCLH